MKVGFIDSIMGTPMAANLVTAGHWLHVSIPAGAVFAHREGRG
jgi:3-hydroxyisobutyrate dehydrogenase-like beta-hydroxyacid dehydrogenase